jgi:hypothetical protein
MNKYVKKIAWQKYEDYLEKQLSSPMLQTIVQNMLINKMGSKEEEDEEDYDDTEDQKILTQMPIFPLSNQLINDVSTLATFDCWIGHTNFDLTHSIKDTLNIIPGVEMLKVFSRYRFFIGIGQLFNFKNVRKDIEKALLGEVEYDND